MNVMTLRQWHGYFGVFIAPSVLFFALTGSLQLFSLHEAHGGYQPPAIIERLGRLHKDQVITLPQRHEASPPKPTASRESTPPVKPEQGPRAPTLLLKIFFLLVAMQLVVSTGLGLWIAFTRNRDRRVTWVLFIAGALAPLALILA